MQVSGMWFHIYDHVSFCHAEHNYLAATIQFCETWPAKDRISIGAIIETFVGIK